MQEILLNLEGWRLRHARYGEGWEICLERVLAYDSLSSAELLALQKARLSQFADKAKKTAAWLDLEELSLESLPDLPILTKAKVLSNIETFITPNRDRLISAHTSGSTGAGLQFCKTLIGEMEQWAVWWRYRMRHGIAFNQLCGYFGGRTIVPAKEKSRYWRFNRPANQLMFSAYHLTSKTVRNYLKKLDELKVEWLHGYPSFLAQVANLAMSENCSRKVQTKVVTIGAESLLPAQKKVIEDFFQAPVRQHYGLAEGVANISECPHGKLHVDEDFSFVEFLPILGQKNQYKIIGTGWSNTAFPLFRYDTGDVATISDENAQCSCGLIGRVVDAIDGRKEDYIFLADGTKVGRMDHLFKDVKGIAEAQLIQEKEGELLALLVKNIHYTEQTLTQLNQEVDRRFSDKLHLTIEFTDKISRTKNGKLRFVINRIVQKL
ncbi:hypothetical protein OAG99_01540 [Akkermansiaceae bacterium]|nr:hypothetical protein [Akkermansiaceae bacterium]MDB4723743.1 hypothetical protein [Akkermansiaceae bacterium]